MNTLKDQPTYGIEGACDYLHVSETSLRELIESGELAASKPSREYVIRKSVMDAYLARLEKEQTDQRKDAFAKGEKPRVRTAVSSIRKRKVIPMLPEMPKAA